MKLYFTASVTITCKLLESGIHFARARRAFYTLPHLLWYLYLFTYKVCLMCTRGEGGGIHYIKVGRDVPTKVVLFSSLSGTGSVSSLKSWYGIQIYLEFICLETATLPDRHKLLKGVHARLERGGKLP